MKRLEIIYIVCILSFFKIDTSVRDKGKGLEIW